MKFSAATALGLAAAANAVTVSFDTVYDTATTPFTSVTCSDGANGLITKYHWSLFSDSPSFPYIGGFEGTTWNSAQCGTCHSLTYNGKTIYILAVDNASGFNIGQQAFTDLTGDAGLGRVDVDTQQVDVSNCKLS